MRWPSEDAVKVNGVIKTNHLSFLNFELPDNVKQFLVGLIGVTRPESTEECTALF
jgi:hypothetical protein